jgi:cytoskeletal protein CcmA (bactofilin family)
MSTIAYIGKSIRIKGTVSAEEPFTVAGIVEGTITVNGHPLTITAEGTLNADAMADTILVEGTATGRLTAKARMTLGNTASVTGEIHAPVLVAAEGATIQGKVDAGSRKKERAA